MPLCDRHYLCSRSGSSCLDRTFRRRLQQKNVGATTLQTMRTLALTMEALKSALDTMGESTTISCDNAVIGEARRWLEVRIRAGRDSQRSLQD